LASLYYNFNLLHTLVVKFLVKKVDTLEPRIKIGNLVKVIVGVTVAQKTIPMFCYFKEISLQHNTITLAYSVKNVDTSILS
jgi:hypothetical protein